MIECGYEVLSSTLRTHYLESLATGFYISGMKGNGKGF